MSKPVATQFAEAIQAALEVVATSGGYYTDLGLSVRRGFWAHVIKAREAPLPAVVIHPGVAQPEALGSSRQQSKLRLSVPLVVIVEIGTGETAYDQLEACTADVRRALYKSSALRELCAGGDLEVGPATPDMSPDSRYVLSAIQATITTIESYGE